MLLATKVSFQSIKPKLSCTILLLLTATRRVPRWQLVTGFGLESAPSKTAGERSSGTRRPQKEVCFFIYSCRMFDSPSSVAMEKFLSGPPGGRTLPQTATRLSDLAGGGYGSGASVASTGLNAQRPAIKAGLARAAGETWEDV